MQQLGNRIRTQTMSVEGILLEYSLFRSEKRRTGGYAYSLSLKETNRGEVSSVWAFDFTRTRGRADEIFSLFSEGGVTACTFFEVLEDLL